jgi:hypothetical protein
MIASEFLAELQKVREQFKWTLTADTSRHPERRSRPRLCIRATYTNPAGEVEFDPIGAVCYANTRKVHRVDDWIEAATALDLSLIDAGNLTAAANDRTWTNDAGPRKPIPQLQQLRSQIAASVGLEFQT